MTSKKNKIHFGKKDTITSELRKKVLGFIPNAVETTDAELGLSTLSFQSTVHPNRQAWIDTNCNGEKLLELEDLSDPSAWDSTVYSTRYKEDSHCLRLIKEWFLGKDPK